MLLAILLYSPAFAADYPARVVGVSDGDTLTVLTAATTQKRIRLNGIDAPETGQDYGSRAKQLPSELAFGKNVTVKPTDTDRYGRTVADVMLPDGRSLNQEMVRGGMTRHPADIRSAEVSVVVLQVEDPLARDRCADQVSARRVEVSLRLSRRARGVEDVERMLAVEWLGGTVG